MKNTSAFDAVDGCAYRYASAVEEEVPPWSARGAKQGEQAWKRRANDSPSDTSARQKASDELVKLIRKLRWSGMEKEAQGLENELGRRRAAAADSVLATAAETD
jgi:hypothetical protein